MANNEEQPIVIEQSFLSNTQFMVEFLSALSQQAFMEMQLSINFLKSKKTAVKIEALTEYIDDGDFDLSTYEEPADVLKISTHMYAYIANVIERAAEGAFRTLSKKPSFLLEDMGVSSVSAAEESEENVDMDITPQQPHQSESSSSKIRGSLDPNVPPFTPSDDLSSAKKDKQKEDLEKGAGSTSQKTRDGGSSKSTPNNSNKNKKYKRNRPRIEKVITGNISTQQINTKELFIYDVPAAWTIHQILVHLKDWGSTIQLSSKRQRKYQTIKVLIELNEEGFAAYQRGEWTVSLGGIPVRWFPGTYSLKERKHRERFVAIIKNLPEDMTTATLYHGTPHQFLLNAKVNAFKIIKTADGSRKLLGYYKNLDDMKAVIGNKQSWGEFSLEWCTLDSLAPKKKERTQPNRSTPEKSRDQKTKKKGKNNGKKPKGSASEQDKARLRKLFADFLSSL
uniref:Chromatin modification-related protein EAF3 n=1 Tax=Anthurium amnicola TaxID=1678845 RepID=A0A1D1YKA8_9ARAE